MKKVTLTKRKMEDYVNIKMRKQSSDFNKEIENIRARLTALETTNSKE